MVEILDAQSHVWSGDRPDYPWNPAFGSEASTYASAAAHYRQLTPISPEMSVRAMNEVNVDAAILVSPTLYGFDPSFAFKAAADHPGRFGVIGVLNPSASNIAEMVRNWRAQPHALGLRIVIMSDADCDRMKHGLYHQMLSEAERAGVPVCVYPPRYLEHIENIPVKYPQLRLVIDHLGFPQPPMLEAYPDPFERLPVLLKLAKFENVSVKLTGVPTLSREPYPYPDVWRPLHAIINAFGLSRSMWGSDWTRVASLVSYSDGVRYMLDTEELSLSDKEHLMGKSLKRLFRWTRE